MKAAILNGYNKNGCDLEITDIPVPAVSDGEVLVKIHTAGVNPLDNMIIKGEVKLIVPYSFPLVMGNEFVGVIEKVGSGVRKFSVGERVLSLGADRFIDYKTEDYASTLSDVDYVLDTLEDRELPKEFGILKNDGKLVSLRGMPNGEFAVRTGMPFVKRLLLKIAGRKYDKLAAKKNQHYFFIFVHEDGTGLERISEIFAERHIEASVDEVFALDDVNKALTKVATGKSKGKTIVKIV